MGDVPDDLLQAAAKALREDGLVEPVMYTDDIGSAETVAYVVLGVVFQRVADLRRALIEAEEKLTEVNHRLTNQLVAEVRCAHPGYFRQGTHCTLCGGTALDG